MARYTNSRDGIARATFRLEIRVEKAAVEGLAAAKGCSLAVAERELRLALEAEMNDHLGWYRAKVAGPLPEIELVHVDNVNSDGLDKLDHRPTYPL